MAVSESVRAEVDRIARVSGYGVDGRVLVCPNYVLESQGEVQDGGIARRDRCARIFQLLPGGKNGTRSRGQSSRRTENHRHGRRSRVLARGRIPNAV